MPHFPDGGDRQLIPVPELQQPVGVPTENAVN